MHITDIITKKKNGLELSKEEIDYFIKGYVNGYIPDYQISSLLMAICLKGMNMEETYNLTLSMIESGDTISLKNIKGIKVDKHSTGGVGDKVTLALGPILASLGVKFAKMSGRGLGHTGGTLDKLESIPGFNVNLSEEEFEDEVNEIGIAVMGQTKLLVPADKKLYALRDVTGTVDSIPLIASSIMSKKLAVGTDIISLDVKVGSGAFMKDFEHARLLAKTMVEIGKRFNRKVSATITNMDEPLGNAIGNSLEVIEAINTLNGKGPKDFLELVLTFAAVILMDAKIVNSIDEGKTLAEGQIKNGEALKKLIAMVKAQNGNEAYIIDPKRFKLGQYKIDIKSKKAGYVIKLDALKLGEASCNLGAGREVIEDQIDHSVGILLNKKVGDKVEIGDTLLTIYSNHQDNLEIEEAVLESYTIGEIKINPTLIYDVIN